MIIYQIARFFRNRLFHAAILHRLAGATNLSRAITHYFYGGVNLCLSLDAFQHFLSKLVSVLNGVPALLPAS
jgi:hypothetical protein